MFTNICMCADPDCATNGCRRQRIKSGFWNKDDSWFTSIRSFPETKIEETQHNPTSMEDLVKGELLETDELKLETNEDTLAILAVVQMQMSKGLTAEDLIKRLLTDPA